MLFVGIDIAMNCDFPKYAGSFGLAMVDIPEYKALGCLLLYADRFDAYVIFETEKPR